MTRSLAILALCCLVHGAAADNAAGAEAAFRRGRALMQENKYAEACTAFEQSQKLDPQIGTRYNLGLCWEKLGKLASAWGAFREVAQRDTNKTRRDEAARKAAALEPRLAKIRITVAAASGVTITSNGDDVTNFVGLDTPIDPGSYQIVAAAPGHQPWSTKIDATPGKVVTVAIPALELTGTAKHPEAPRPTAKPEPTRAPAAQPAATTAATAAPATGSKRGTIGKLTIGAGGAVLATGIVFGVLARSKWNAVRDVCGDDFVCDSDQDLTRGNELADAARLRGNLATGLVGVGLAGVAVGVALVLTAPSPRERAALRVVPVSDGRSVGVVLGGGF